MSTKTFANRGWPAFLALLALASAARANVLVVDAAGAPGTFAQVQPAIAAAADGDVILIRPGTYAGFSNASPAKALDFVGDVTGTVTIAGNVQITGLPAARAVTLHGLSIAGTTSASALRLTSNAGSVRVQACRIEGASQPGCACYTPGRIALDVDASLDVCVSHCELIGGAGGDCSRSSIGPGPGGRGVSATSSRVALYDTVARGGKGGDLAFGCPDIGYGYCYAGSGGEGAFTSTSPAFFASNSSFVGGDGGDDACWYFCVGFGASGLRVQGGTQASVLQCTPLAGQCGVTCAPVPGCAPPPAVSVQGASLTTLAGTARRMTGTRVAREAQPVRVDLFGQPGDQVELTFSDRARFLYSVPLRGVSALLPSRPQAVAQLGTIGASGTLSTAWIVPDLGTGASSRRVFVQATFRDAVGVTTLGTPLEIVLLDATY